MSGVCSDCREGKQCLLCSTLISKEKTCVCANKAVLQVVNLLFTTALSNR